MFWNCLAVNVIPIFSVPALKKVVFSVKFLKKELVINMECSLFLNFANEEIVLLNSRTKQSVRMRKSFSTFVP